MWANRLGCSPKLRDVSESLRLLTKNEQFAQVAHQIWATMSDLLRSLTKNELMSELLVFLSESLIRSFFRKKRAIGSENRWANSQPCFFVNSYLSPSKLIARVAMLYLLSSQYRTWRTVHTCNSSSQWSTSNQFFVTLLHCTLLENLTNDAIA